MKTNAIRILEQAAIAVRLLTYEVGEAHLPAEEVAHVLGLHPESVFKTLVAQGDKSGCLFAVIPAPASLNLKALAQVSGNKRVELLPLKDVLERTGYVRGAVTVLGAKKAFPAFADETIELWDEISVSAGARGLQVLLAPTDYLHITQAKLANLVE
jgi:Cys-tRNA(Pro)/Cys-tRNA(Cys) deacylase